MIISASYRTDIPAFFAPWFRMRLDAGFCKTINPYNGKISEVSLSKPAVDGFVFWTRNCRPFFGACNDVADAGFPFVVLFTVTGYPRALDASTISKDNAIDQIQTLSNRFGRRAVVWRYDPIVFSSLTPPEWHVRQVSNLARAIGDSVDEVIFSVAQIYRKSARNLDQAASRHGFTWWDPDVEEKKTLLRELAAVSHEHGLRPSLCAQRDLLVDGLDDAACIDVNRLSDVARYAISTPRQPHRERCGCWASRDIGAYDTCPHGCAYCYAVANQETAKRHYRTHDVTSPFLLPPERPPEEPAQGDLFKED